MKKYIIIGVVYVCLLFFVAAAVADRISNDDMVNTTNADGKIEKSSSGYITLKGELSENISPFNYSTSADKYFLSMCYGNLYESDNTICSGIDENYEKKHNVTTYRISIKKDAATSSGGAITADDIIYNYYLRCDPIYDGSDEVAQADICGLLSYQTGLCDKTDSQVRKIIKKMIKNPDRKLKKIFTDSLIKKILKEKYSWVRSLYDNPVYSDITQKYPNSKRLFSYFFSLNTRYSVKGKNVSQVICDIAGQYNGKYAVLSKFTGESYDETAEKLVIKYLYSKNKKSFLTKKNSIDGIKKLNDNTVQIVVHGKSSEKKRKMLFDFYVVSKNYPENCTGRYYPVSYSDTGVILTDNLYKSN